MQKPAVAFFCTDEYFPNSSNDLCVDLSAKAYYEGTSII